MGEIADLMLDGEICEGCGMELDDGAPGYPRRCFSCAKLEKEYRDHKPPEPLKKPNPMPKVRCPMCNKTVSPRGIVDHLLDVHGFDK